jgi:crotonobetainyl-CoA:carnitine CoA-transferase CaiB-like acyl-CoA transferase
MSPLPGWEHNAEAVSGMQTARGVGGVPRQVPYPVNDYMTGLLGAYGVLLALHERALTGVGSWVRGSLARSATFTQMLSSTLGHTWIVPCADGEVRVHAVDGQSVPDVAEIRAYALANSTLSVMRESKRRGWFAVVEGDVRRQFRHGEFAPFTLEWDQTSAGSVRQAFTPAFGDHAGQGAPRWPAPDPGSDTESVLLSAGCTAADIDEWMRDRVVSGRVALFS